MLPVAPFGNTGRRSTRVIFGAAALGAMSQERSDETMALVDRWGINHIDTAASYGDSELRLRPWLDAHRAEVFLATKTGERDGVGARRSLERSLERMAVQHVDMIQLHNLVEHDEWERAFAPGGAVEALAAARDEGLVSHIGVTGHGLRIAAAHLRSVERFDFASVLLPVNFILLDQPEYRSDLDRLLAVCDERGIAVQTIKSIARGRWSPDVTRRFSWYEPLTDPDAIARAVRFVLSHPAMFLNTTSDARLLEPIIAAADVDDAVATIAAPDPAELRADIEQYGISALFDGAALERI
jgi:aryl-alcohol dehydrogenase-like predicted oxidoreductase